MKQSESSPSFDQSVADASGPCVYVGGQIARTALHTRLFVPLKPGQTSWTFTSSISPPACAEDRMGRKRVAAPHTAGRKPLTERRIRRIQCCKCFRQGLPVMTAAYDETDPFAVKLTGGRRRAPLAPC
jgi:hypothetical protein